MENPHSASDVAAYVLQKQGRMSAWKLQKLLYYCQAWSLVWDSKPLFREKIKAWDNGPVVPQVYHEHRGKYTVLLGDVGGKPDGFSDDEIETMDMVLLYYGNKPGWWLSDLSHAEDPWKEARFMGERCDDNSPEITHESMRSYYESVLDCSDATELSLETGDVET